MEERLAFVPCPASLPCQTFRRTTASRPKISMASASSVTRRRLGQWALAASAAAVAGALSNPAVAFAASATKRPTFIKDDSGISYYEVKDGSGQGPVEGDFVVVDYLAFLSNGKIFDNRKGFVFQMGQRQVIPGLESAVATMKPGGERKVVIPPTLAYGDKGVCLTDKKECLVPPGETLGYDLTLQRVAIPPT